MSLQHILLFLAILLVLLYLYFKRKYNYWKNKGVPHPEPVFLFGNTLDIPSSKDSVGIYIGKLSEKYSGPYFGFYVLTSPFLIVNDPEIIKLILVKDFNSFTDRLLVSDEKIDPLLSNSLLGVKEPPLKALRSRLSPVFTSAKIKMMCALMIDCGKSLEKYIESKVDNRVEAKEISAKYTTDVIASCAFGIEANSFKHEDSEFCVAGRRLFQPGVKRVFHGLSYFMMPQFVKLFKLQFIEPVAGDFLREVFTETMLQREAGGVKRNDLIDILIELKNQETSEEEFKFYGDRLVAQAVIFFGAGYETTSSTIALTLHELCVNTDIQDRLRAEIEDVIRKHGELTYEAIQEMKYLDMVISETLRKYSLTPFIQRICTRTYTVPQTGLVIDKDVTVLISQHGLHWNPKYFPNPDKYDPERFNEFNKSKIVPYTYLPFGAGPRVCIGERFGILNSKIGIISTLRKYRVERNELTQEPLKFSKVGLLKAENGIQLTYKKL